MEKIKLEKMRIAMQKMKRARFQQLVVKAVNADGSTKMAVVDETMTAWDVCKLMVEKNRTQLGPNWTLIEKLPSLHIGEYIRTYVVTHTVKIERGLFG